MSITRLLGTGFGADHPEQKGNAMNDMKRCKCGSYAINLHCHGRDNTDVESCDVCYWRHKADHAIAAMKAKSDAEVVWPSCQTCGGKTVCIRGRYPDQPGREVCPTCLAERMDTIREVADRDYGRAYQAAPLDLAKKIGEAR